MEWLGGLTHRTELVEANGKAANAEAMRWRGVGVVPKPWEARVVAGESTT